MTHRPHRLALFVLCAATLMPATARAQWNAAAASPPPLYPYELQPGQSYAVEVAPGAYVVHRPAASNDYPYVGCGAACGAAVRPSRHVARRSAHRVVRHAAPRVAHRAAPRTVRHAALIVARDVERPAAHDTARPKSKPRHVDRTPKRNDPALIEQLRRGDGKPVVVTTKKVVHDRPVVVVHRRVVEDPPRVVVRPQYVDEPPAGARSGRRGLLTREPERSDIAPMPGPEQSDIGATLAPQRRHNRATLGDEKRVIHAEAEVTILGPDRMNIRLYRKGSEDAEASERK